MITALWEGGKGRRREELADTCTPNLVGCRVIYYAFLSCHHRCDTITAVWFPLAFLRILALLLELAGQIPLVPATMALAELEDPLETVPAPQDPMQGSLLGAAEYNGYLGDLGTLIKPAVALLARLYGDDDGDGGNSNNDSDTRTKCSVRRQLLRHLVHNLVLQLYLSMRHARRVLLSLRASGTKGVLGCTVYINCSHPLITDTANASAACSWRSGVGAELVRVLGVPMSMVAQQMLQRMRSLGVDPLYEEPVAAASVEGPYRRSAFDRPDGDSGCSDAEGEGEGEGAEQSEMEGEQAGAASTPVLMLGVSGLPRSALIEVEVGALRGVAQLTSIDRSVSSRVTAQAAPCPNTTLYSFEEDISTPPPLPELQSSSSGTSATESLPAMTNNKGQRQGQQTPSNIGQESNSAAVPPPPPERAQKEGFLARVRCSCVCLPHSVCSGFVTISSPVSDPSHDTPLPKPMVTHTTRLPPSFVEHLCTQLMLGVANCLKKASWSSEPVPSAPSSLARQNRFLIPPSNSGSPVGRHLRSVRVYYSIRAMLAALETKWRWGGVSDTDCNDCQRSAATGVSAASDEADPETVPQRHNAYDPCPEQEDQIEGQMEVEEQIRREVYRAALRLVYTRSQLLPHGAGDQDEDQNQNQDEDEGGYGGNGRSKAKVPFSTPSVTVTVVPVHLISIAVGAVCGGASAGTEDALLMAAHFLAVECQPSS